MPIAKSLMDNLVRQYGKDKGEAIYYSMEAEGSGPFAKGKKHRAMHLAFVEKHGIQPVSKGKKKPPASSKKRGASR
jgi:hypothetical protein